jgi:hypothetical protein
MLNSDIKFMLSAGLSLTILLIVLFFGLSGKGFHFSNGVTWIKDKPGIRFGNYGIAYAIIDDDQTKHNISRLKAFSIEIAIKPEAFDLEGFNLILSLYGGKDSNQLIVGQWKSYLIAMNGDDYSNKRKIKRISTDIDSDSPEKILLTITAGEEGTKLYIDGKLLKAESNLFLKIPGDNNLKITLGNSVYGKASWRGEVYGLALYADRLEPETIEKHFKDWSKNQILSFSRSENTLLFFTFNDGKGTETIDYVSGIQKLNIPPRFQILKKSFVSLPWRDFQADKSYLIDLIINLLGFIPSGFILCALFVQAGGILQKKALLLSVFLCFLISLCIEIVQAWIPSRSSQGLDLILNTFGALMGAKLYMKSSKLKAQR